MQRAAPNRYLHNEGTGLKHFNYAPCGNSRQADRARREQRERETEIVETEAGKQADRQTQPRSLEDAERETNEQTDGQARRYF